MKRMMLQKRLDALPMLRVAVPFIAGIAAADCIALPEWFTLLAAIVAGSLALLLRSSAATVALLLAAGFGTAQLHRHTPSVPVGAETLFRLTVSTDPSRRTEGMQSQARVEAWHDSAADVWHPAADRLLLLFDERLALAEGDRLWVRGRIYPFRSEPLRHRMQRRGIAGRLYLTAGGLLGHDTGGGGLHRRAAERIARLGIAGEPGAVVAAMVAGDRSGLTAAQRTRYARSGMAHLLAVSGLHAGIVLVAVNLLLAGVALLRRGRLIRSLLAIAALWTYVAAAGAPPSAVRCAVMGTLLQTALARGTEYRALNALAAAAVTMLLWEPAWLYDTGFRLSLIAVAAILAWGVPLARRIRIRGLRLVTDTLAVGCAATLATLPLVSHTFGIVPLAGIPLNPAVIALATAVVAGGVLWLVAPLPALAPLLRPLVAAAAEGIDRCAALAAALPGGVVEYRLPEWAVAALYLLFIAATALAWSSEPKKSVHLPA